MNITETTRLFLCGLSIVDSPFIFELLNTPGWLEFIGNKNVKSVEDATNYILNGPVKSYEQFGFGLYLVKLKDSNMPIGICGLIKRETLDDVDIGFALLPEYSGKGYAFEAASAVMAYAKTNLSLNRIVAITTPANHSSIKLLKKLGLEFEKIIISPTGEELMLFGTLMDKIS